MPCVAKTKLTKKREQAPALHTEFPIPHLSDKATNRELAHGKGRLRVVAEFPGTQSNVLHRVTACMFYIEGSRIAFPSIDTMISIE